MKHEVELKVQGYLDNQLSAAEMQKVADLISRDAEARTLFEALRGTKLLVVGNEPEYKLAETREFYWSKIEREIRKQGASPVPARSAAFGWHNWWVRFAGAGAALALVGAVALSSSRFGFLGGSHSQEVESPEDMSAITFHSEVANMTVVWVQPREDTN